MICRIERILNLRVVVILFFSSMTMAVCGQNPIVPYQGLNDPHIHIFNDTAYVYASHDKSAENTEFIMENWWVWSSSDLVNWKQESILKPESTYIGKPFTGCWATDVGYRNGNYYWYFSERNKQTGVVVGNSPIGPWSDPLGKPLLTSELTPTHEYDMAIFEENGDHYIIFGVWDYYIAKLNDDMISLAEKPKKIAINNPRGPYNPDGKNKEKPTDDKPSLHKYNGKYYLSWGCFYAMADNLYGPYDYKDTVIKKESFAPGYDAPTWPNGFLQGRHGNFFEWNNQWYYTYCDISQTGNRYFRDAFISYVHYKKNGEMAPIRVDGIGVGRYEANQPKIEAEDYFKAIGFKKIEYADNSFSVRTTEKIAFLNFPNVEGLDTISRIKIKIAVKDTTKFTVELRKDSQKGVLIGSKEVDLSEKARLFEEISIDLEPMKNKENIYLIVHQSSEKQIQIDSFSFLK